MEIDYESLGQRIEQLRTSRKPKVSRDKLAEIVGVSSTSIYRWERAIDRPSLENIAKVAKYFGVSTGELIDQPSPKPPRAPEGTTMADLAKGLANIEHLLKNDFNQAFLHSTPKRQAVALYILTGDPAFLEVIPKADLGPLLEGPLDSLEEFLG